MAIIRGARAVVVGGPGHAAPAHAVQVVSPKGSFIAPMERRHIYGFFVARFTSDHQPEYRLRSEAPHGVRTINDPYSFGSVLDTGLIGTIALVTGALPAEFGMRTVGLVDITTRADAFNNSGSVSLYGGSRGTITPSLEYGGTVGGNCPTQSTGVTKAPPTWRTYECTAPVQYFFSGRYLQTTEGIENPTPSLNEEFDAALHALEPAIPDGDDEIRPLFWPLREVNAPD